jgi:hypothetical protein
MYRVIDTTALAARARYDRGVQYSTPVALPVRDAAGAECRATYVDHSLLAFGRAVYRIGDAEYVLCPSGALEPVDAAELPAIEPVEGAAL